MKKIAYINPDHCDRSPFCPVKRACPFNAISQDGSFFNYKAPKVNPEICTGCGKCVTACPHGAVSLKSIQ